MFSELMYWFEDETAFYVAMKFYPEGSLNVHCKEPVYESDGITIMKQVFEGLRFLHGEGIIHADLRSEVIDVTPLSTLFASTLTFSRIFSSPRDPPAFGLSSATLATQHEVIYSLQRLIESVPLSIWPPRSSNS